jgi:crossover junction endodeoxyribonuclease RusA
MLPFEFVIDGLPMSAQSHNPERLTAWKVAVAAAATQRWEGSPFRGNARVVVTYYHARETAGLDGDNMVKPILDALIGIVYDDDRQATHITARSVRLRDGHNSKLGAMTAMELTRGRDFLHIRVEEDR